MDEFLSSLVANSNNFIGGRTIFPGPAAVPSRGHGPVVLPSTSTSAASSSAHRQHGIMAASQQVLGSRQENVISQGAPPSSSILRLSDMSPMIAWLKSQSSVVTESEPSTNQSSEVYTFEDYQKRIPKPYIELTERDCAGVVAKAIKSIVLHTCNDEFRQKCFSKLGVTNHYKNKISDFEINLSATWLIL